MAEDDLTIFYFDGTDGCDFCNLLTGYTFAPEFRPHPNCDCPIECIDMETEGDCHFELRDVEWDEAHDEVVRSYPNDYVCLDDDSDLTDELDASAYENNNLSDELEEAARAAGWSPPEVETITIGLTIPARTRSYEVEQTSMFYHADVEAMRVLVCDVGGYVSVKEVDMEFGDYSSVYDIERDILSTESCD